MKKLQSTSKDTKIKNKVFTRYMHHSKKLLFALKIIEIDIEVCIRHMQSRKEIQSFLKDTKIEKKQVFSRHPQSGKVLQSRSKGTKIDHEVFTRHMQNRKRALIGFKEHFNLRTRLVQYKYRAERSSKLLQRALKLKTRPSQGMCIEEKSSNLLQKGSKLITRSSQGICRAVKSSNLLQTASKLLKRSA